MYKGLFQKSFVNISAIICICLLNILLMLPTASSGQTEAAGNSGTIKSGTFESEILKENKIGISLTRTIKIYLPPDYEGSNKSFPVIYYLHNIGWSNDKMFARDPNVKVTLDNAISSRNIPPFILVVPDYTSPTIGSWFENSPVSGKWLDYTIDEVVTYVDKHYRTLRHKDSRGITGDYMGGYGAFKLAMLHPEIFGSVYALHPVAGGEGLMPASYSVDWNRLFAAKEFKELWGDHYAPGFVAMSQAYLPNIEHPPFYCDFVVRMVDGKPQMVSENVRKLQSQFLLDHLVDAYESNLRKVNAIAFDWARYDQTVAHVTSLQSFTRKLDQLGINHVAEEYNGSPFDRLWIRNGRVSDRVIPFFARNLKFN